MYIYIYMYIYICIYKYVYIYIYSSIVYTYYYYHYYYHYYHYYYHHHMYLFIYYQCSPPPKTSKSCHPSVPHPQILRLSSSEATEAHRLSNEGPELFPAGGTSKMVLTKDNLGDFRFFHQPICVFFVFFCFHQQTLVDFGCIYIYICILTHDIWWMLACYMLYYINQNRCFGIWNNGKLLFDNKID